MRSLSINVAIPTVGGIIHKTTNLVTDETREKMSKAAMGNTHNIGLPWSPRRRAAQVARYAPQQQGAAA